MVGREARSWFVVITIMVIVIGSVIYFSEYFMPQKKWPAWAAALLLLGIAGSVMVWQLSHRSPQQVICDYERIMSELRESKRMMEKAEKEQWPEDVCDRLAKEYVKQIWKWEELTGKKYKL